MRIDRTSAKTTRMAQQLVPQKDVAVMWNEHEKAIVLTVRNVQDIDDSGSHFDYDIVLSGAEVAHILDKISTDGLANRPHQLHDAFKNHIPNLIRLLTCASGSVPGPMP
jgi:hypothetical protein